MIQGWGLSSLPKGDSWWQRVKPLLDGGNTQQQGMGGQMGGHSQPIPGPSPQVPPTSPIPSPGAQMDPMWQQRQGATGQRILPPQAMQEMPDQAIASPVARALFAGGRDFSGGYVGGQVMPPNMNGGMFAMPMGGSMGEFGKPGSDSFAQQTPLASRGRFVGGFGGR